MTSLLIKNAAAIMTGLAGAAARHAGPDIRISAGRIAALGALTPQPGEQILDATDCVIYPAWVNTHHHLFQALLKGEPLGLNATLTPWLAATPYRFRAGFDAASFRLAARIGLIELALSGCATVADHNYLYYPGQDYDSSAILFEEAARLGLRFVLCRGGATLTRQLEAELPQALRPESMAAYMADMERLASQFHDPAPEAMRRVVMAPTTPPYSMQPGELREAAAVARKLGLRLHSHLSETVGYQDSVNAMRGISPVRYCESIDWLGADVWFAHLVKLDPDEIALLGATRTGIAHCPQSNGRLGSGIAPIRTLEAAGVPVSIGVDGAASNEAADMISETHVAWLMQRAKGGEAAQPKFRGGAGEAGADAASVEDVIRWGSSGGAAVLGLPAIGSLAEGQAADIAIYDLSRNPRYFGLHDLAIAPVACGGSAHLRSLLVGGREIVREGAIPDLDMAELAAEARAATRALIRRAEAA
ncbi:amidohydrolase family protein [Uliginosibacterium aquaticum]|uniref:Amidohydrolase family protein n=1 Tax=Uliginosibacterium aquaticum TaxID=2731212 RepID=A0ABX2IBJ7_9RHOO|nr:amidohydrolase family protein [Uliginosibacterium aquaticum]NSL53810.1 amidohydrolase family protein [Uliginosibacterium aquaticum]